MMDEKKSQAHYILQKQLGIFYVYIQASVHI